MRPLKLTFLWHALGLAYLAMVVYGSLTPSPPDLSTFPGADKGVHVAVYAGMMLWFGFLYQSRRSVLVFGMLFVSLGIALDLLQGTTGHRSMELLDMVANAIGVLIGALLSRTRLGPALIRLEALVFEGRKKRKGFDS